MVFVGTTLYAATDNGVMVSKTAGQWLVPTEVARYDVDKNGFTPRRGFRDDAKTIALWHFDEPSGTQKFSDASGNAYHLVGKNGAETGGTLAVDAQRKLAMVWGRLKE